MNELDLVDYLLEELCPSPIVFEKIKADWSFAGGSNNIFIGYSAGMSLSVGSANTAISTAHTYSPLITFGTTSGK